MEGAAVSVVSEGRLRKVLPDAEFKATNIKLKTYIHIHTHTYTSERITLRGVTWVTCIYMSHRLIPLCWVWWNELHIKTPYWARYGIIPSMVSQRQYMSVYSPTETGETNSLWKVSVCSGHSNDIYEATREIYKYWMVDTRELPEWRL